MDHAILKQVIFDQHEIIRETTIVSREYQFEQGKNYALVGLRRAGKSTLLYQMAQELVAEGVDWNQIIYVNFEDERLGDFTVADFNDIVQVQSELSAHPGHFFFDEIQIVDGWEKFARRMADAKEHVCITGSNAHMLSSEIATTLGGRYLIRNIAPYNLREYLGAMGQAFDERALVSTKASGRILAAYSSFCHFGGLPEVLEHKDKRDCVDSVFQKVVLNDIVARNDIRNVKALRVLLKKVAETVRNEVSYSALHNTMKNLGYKIGKDTVINYISYAEEAYLLFHLENLTAAFVEREGNPKYYFGDNGLLNLFIKQDSAASLENAVALALYHRYREELSYLKSSKTGIDVDFVIPDAGLAVQAAYSVSGDARSREVGNLVKLARADKRFTRFVIVTHGESDAIKLDDVRIEVIPAYRFLVQET